MEKIRELIPIVLAMLVSIGVAIVVHELAHLVMALTLGWKIRALQIGPFSITGGRPQYSGQWHPGNLSLRPGSMDLVRFARELRLVVIAGPISNILIGIAALASGSLLWESFGAMQLAIGLSNLIPSARRNAPLGNDGNVIFRICRDPKLLQELYLKSVSTTTD